MRNNISKYYNGFIKIRLECEESERFLKLCACNNLQLWNIKCLDTCYECELTIKDFLRIQPFRRKTKAKIKILEKYGLPFFFHKNKKRKAFFIGVVICCILLYICSLFIWEIRIEGNSFYSDGTIIDVLNSNNITEGIKKSVLESGKISEDLRKIFPELVWVSVKIKGTTLIIDIKENENSKLNEEMDMDTWDLVAKKDGVVRAIITRVGMPKVSVGDICKKGDVIVSGIVEILDNDFNVKNYEYRGADADVLIETSYSYYDEFQLEYDEKVYNQKDYTYPFIQIGNRMFGYTNQKNKNIELIQQSVQLHLTDSFYLPISIGKTIVRPYKYLKNTYSEDDARSISDNRLRNYMMELTKKNIEIKEKNMESYIESGKYITKGTITVFENATEKRKIAESNIYSKQEKEN